MTVPYTFADASQNIALAELDANFSAVGTTDGIEYTAPYTNSTIETVTAKLSQTISVMDFIPNNINPATTDVSGYIQNAINAAATSGASTGYGNVVYFPPGNYLINETLNMPGSQYVSLQGAGGKVSILNWNGSNNSAIVLFNNGSSESAVFINQLGFQINNSQTGIIGIQTCKTPGNAVVNLCITQCYFLNLDTALQTNTETDELLFLKNYILQYTSYGIAVLGGVNSNYQIRDNQFRLGSPTSIGIYSAGGSNYLIQGNTIQTASTGRGCVGIKINSVYAFSITSNYFEVQGTNTSGHGPFINLLSCSSGVIESNYSTGDVGNQVVNIDASCSNVRIGPNTHAISGGTPSYFVNIGIGATNIEIDGIQTVLGGSFPTYNGNPTFCTQPSFIYTEQYHAKGVGTLNIPSSSSSLIFTGSTGQGFMVTADQVTEGYSASSIVIFNQSGATNVFSLGQTNSNFTISASGFNVFLNNGVTATRTCNYVVTRIF